jgi:hypothetical protein
MLDGIARLETCVSVKNGIARMSAYLWDDQDNLLTEQHAPIAYETGLTVPMLSSLEAALWGLELAHTWCQPELVHHVDSVALAERLNRAPRPGEPGAELVRGYRALVEKLGKVRVLRSPHPGMQNFIAQKVEESTHGLID